MVDILICMESWLKVEDNIQFAGFFTYRKDKAQPRAPQRAIRFSPQWTSQPVSCPLCIFPSIKD